jgi:hypothetical protein
MDGVDWNGVVIEMGGLPLLLPTGDAVGGILCLVGVLYILMVMGVAPDGVGCTSIVGVLCVVGVLYILLEMGVAPDEVGCRSFVGVLCVVGVLYILLAMGVAPDGAGCRLLRIGVVTVVVGCRAVR